MKRFLQFQKAPQCVLLALLTQVPAMRAQTAPPPGGATNSPAPREAIEPAPRTLDNRLRRAPDQDYARLKETANRQGAVRVMVGLQVSFTPEGARDTLLVRQQREAIANARQRLLGTLNGTPYTVIRTYDAVPAIALSLSVQALETLRVSAQAATIGEDLLLTPSLATTTKRIEATEAAVFNRTGAGQIVAILDTGVEASHPFLQQSNGGPSKVLGEACFTNNSCPNGSSTQTGAGAAAPCSYHATCDHGTHVAGIAAGRDDGVAGMNGVARSANLIAVQIFSNLSGAPGAYTSDIVAGLNHVYSLATSTTPLPIAAVNMSLGGGLYSSDCDTIAPWDTVKPAIDNLRSAGIATVVAAGNDSYKAGVSGPACISTAVAVGATNSLADYVVNYSNSSASLDLLAPGAVTSSVSGGAYGYKVGTSMAAPHVAGAWAILKQLKPSGSVAALLSHLQVTGLPVTDTASNITTPRIRVLAASVRLGDTGFVDAETISGNGALTLVSKGAGLATRSGGSNSGTIAIPPIASASQVVAAYLYWMTLGGPDDTVTFRGQTITGTLIGASRNTCWPAVNPLGPNRVYRAKLPASLVVGNGSYVVSGIGADFSMDGQGASLVVAIAPQYYEYNTTRVIKIRHGAMTSDSNANPLVNTFSSLAIPYSPSHATLHIGAGDTAISWTEDSIYFAGSPITPAGPLAGLDGAQWDDVTIAIPTSLLPAGATSATTSLSLGNTSFGDCMAWAYSALSYKYKSPPQYFQ